MCLTAEDGVRLDARLDVPAAPRGALVACHPHPMMGGTMDSPVVRTLVGAFARRGFATLRFQFRGSGRSTGAHGGGRDEVRDVAAAARALEGELGGRVPAIRAIGGYSFGAWVGLECARSEPWFTHRLAIAPPLAMLDDHGFLAAGTPLSAIAGSADEYCPRPLLGAALPCAPILVEGADHFFAGRFEELARAIDAVLDGWTA